MSETTFKQVAVFQYSSEAQIFKGKLESVGIDVFMHDNFTIDSDPLLSQAVGGVKLFVRSEDYKIATEILTEVHLHSVSETGDPIICPNCRSENVDLFSTVKDTKSFFSFAFSLVMGALPFYTKYKYRCSNCKFEFTASWNYS